MTGGPQLPWPPDRRPLSLVAFGNSVTFLQMPGRVDRAEGTYVEVLADRLASEGVPTHAHLSGKWFDFVHRAARDYETRVRQYLPDVLIVQFGLNEYQPWLAPVWLLRHLLVQNAAVSRTATVYRRHVAARLWRWLRTYRKWAAPKVGLHTWQLTPRRFRGHLRRVLTLARAEGRPLVLVLDIDEPRGTLGHFLPGLDRRHAVYQDVIASVVANIGDPEVRLVRVSELTRSADASVLPDGMHYSAAAHEIIGDALAAEVLDWLRQRGKDDD